MKDSKARKLLKFSDLKFLGKQVEVCIPYGDSSECLDNLGARNNQKGLGRSERFTRFERLR